MNEPSRCCSLALLPNGEAVRPEEVRRVSIDPAPSLLQLEEERFMVSVELADGSRRRIAAGLSRADAADLGRRCTRAINDALKTGS
ncbi:hypothetical protein SH611_14025 [Geminicoccaceae bacterium 1502E]|nr:hypothetical protein [Geminicoccaceae bacterium 1502E]